MVNNFLQKGTISSGVDNIEFSAGQDDSYYGVIRSKNKNSKYEGGIFEEKKEGYGKYFENDMKVFEGYFADNLPYGKGILYGKDGNILFKGIFREGLKMHGVSCIDGKTVSGIIHHHTLTVHDPSWFITLNVREVWVDGVIELDSKSPKVSGKFSDKRLTIDGPAIIRYPDGSDYIGRLEANNKVGKGVFRQISGLKVVGTWNKAGVTGKVFWGPTGDKIYSEGEFKFDHTGKLQQHGYGNIVYRDGSIYRGELDFDSRQGYGKFVNTAGDIYCGKFDDDLYHGTGQIEYKSSGVVCQGEFKNGFREGGVIFISKSGAKFYGWFINDEMHFMVVDLNNISTKIAKWTFKNLVSEVRYDESSQNFSCNGLAYADLEKIPKGKRDDQNFDAQREEGECSPHGSHMRGHRHTPIQKKGMCISKSQVSNMEYFNEPASTQKKPDDEFFLEIFIKNISEGKMEGFGHICKFNADNRNNQVIFFER